MLMPSAVALARQVSLNWKESTLTVISGADAPDGAGGTTFTPDGMGATMKCRLAIPHVHETQGGGGTLQEGLWHVFIPYDQDLPLDRQVNVDGSLYNVLYAISEPTSTARAAETIMRKFAIQVVK